MSNSISSDGYNLQSYLWTGESVWCKCGHHVNCHYTNTPELVKKGHIATCIFETSKGDCRCREFRPYRDNKTVKLRATNQINVIEPEKDKN
jgi:hypothetical protein